MRCINCNCKSTKKNPVTKAPDPYNSDINDDETKVWECADCRQQSANDI